MIPVAAVIAICTLGPQPACVIVESAPTPSAIVCFEVLQDRVSAWREILGALPRVGAPDGGEIELQAECRPLVPAGVPGERT